MRLSTKLSILFLLLSVAPLGILGYLAYSNGRGTIERETVDRLRSINILKEAQINRWIHDNTRTMEILAGGAYFREKFADEVAQHDQGHPSHPSIHREVSEQYLKPVMEQAGLIELFVLRADDGLILVSTDERQEGKYRESMPYFVNGRDRTYVQNVYYSMALQQPAMTIGTPLRDGRGRLVGVLAGRVDLTDLSRIMEQTSGLSQTEKTYLVNTFNFFVTEPPAGKGFTLKKSVQTEGVQAALSRRSGIGFYEDYRAVPVIGIYHWMEERELCLITEMDQSEALAPIHAFRATIVLFGVGAALVASLTGWLCARAINRPVKRLVEGMRAIAGGNLDFQVMSTGKDEIGELSRSFARMTERLKETLVSRDALEQEIVERKQAEEALLQSEGRLRRAERIGHLGNWSFDLRDKRLVWSDEMYRIYGRDKSSALPTLKEHMEIVHPEDRETYRKAMKNLWRNGEGSYELRIIRPDGALRHLTGSGEVLRDPSGEAVVLFGTVLDTTELREREFELQLKSTELERFAYAISHDLKSPLVTIKTFLGYLQKDLKTSDEPRIEQDVFYIAGAADKMARLLDELLEMTRIGRLTNPTTIASFDELVSETLRLLAGPIAQRGVTVQIRNHPVVLRGDRARLVEIWQNLVENATKFMGAQAAPRIEIGAEGNGRETVFHVSDNGVGIDPRYHERIFGLFEKLDPAAEGSGLGLSLVKKIIELYGGAIRLESDGAGQGTRFLFTLPDAVVDNTEGSKS